MWPIVDRGNRETFQDIQERYFEITDDWVAEDPRQQWRSVAELDELLRELADVDQPDRPVVQELREGIEALTDEIENQLEGSLVCHRGCPIRWRLVWPKSVDARDGSRDDVFTHQTGARTPGPAGIDADEFGASCDHLIVWHRPLHPPWTNPPSTLSPPSDSSHRNAIIRFPAPADSRTTRSRVRQPSGRPLRVSCPVRQHQGLEGAAVDHADMSAIAMVSSARPGFGRQDPAPGLVLGDPSMTVKAANSCKDPPVPGVSRPGTGGPEWMRLHRIFS